MESSGKKQKITTDNQTDVNCRLCAVKGRSGVMGVRATNLGRVLRDVRGEL